MTSIPQFHRSSGIARRRFLKLTAGTAAFVATAGTWLTRRAWPFAQTSPPTIHKFVEPQCELPLPGGPANGQGQFLPVLQPHPAMFGTPATAVDEYFVGAAQFQTPQPMHPDLPGPTTFWGYYDRGPPGAPIPPVHQYLGGVILATRGKAVLLHVTNQLPTTGPIIPTDPTIMAGPTETVAQLPPNAITAHLHGGDTPWLSDGTPFTWFDSTGQTGPSFVEIPNTARPTASDPTATYFYPMNQSARFVWYHDHAIGITRTNVYSGLASGILLTDDFEQGLLGSPTASQRPPTPLLPDMGTVLAIQDKTFISTTLLDQDPTWASTGLPPTPGNLWYPHQYQSNQGGGAGPNSCAGPNGNPVGRWDYGPCINTTPGNEAIPPSVLDPEGYKLPSVSVVAEAFLDTSLVNGGVYPVLHVQPKRVRFRMLNAAQARFYHLNILPETDFGEVAVNTSAPGQPPIRPAPESLPAMFQIGTEGGFLPKVVPLPNGTPLSRDPGDATGQTVFLHPPEGSFNLVLAPAERADVIVDFAGFAGQNFILYNDAPAPFPGGDARNDYFTGDDDFTEEGGAPSTNAGEGPNTRTVMRIVVDPLQGPADNPVTSQWVNDLTAQLQKNFAVQPQPLPNPLLGPGQQPALLYNNGTPFAPGPVFQSNQVPAIPNVNPPSPRQLTLNEDFDEFGRLIQTLGTFTESTNNQGLPTWGQPYIAPATENPAGGATEVWQIYNMTADVHPIHFHLVNVQVIQRQMFFGEPPNPVFVDPTNPGSAPTTPFPPDDNEIGWKDTVRMNPGEVTTVIMKFDLPVAPFTVPPSPRTGGHEYVWHCHILEHEEHDMMRPLVVMTPPV